MFAFLDAKMHLLMIFCKTVFLFNMWLEFYFSYLKFNLESSSHSKL